VRSAKLRVTRAEVDVVVAAANLGHAAGTLLGRYAIKLDGRRPRGSYAAGLTGPW